MDKIIILFMITLAFFLSPASSSSLEPDPEPEVNRCYDPASWAKWNQLVAKHPEDDDIQILHGLRIGLCAKIEQGTVSLEKAAQLFDKAHQTVIRRKKLEELEESDSSI